MNSRLSADAEFPLTWEPDDPIYWAPSAFILPLSSIVAIFLYGVKSKRNHLEIKGLNKTYRVRLIGTLHRSEPRITLHEFRFIQEGLGDVQKSWSFISGTLLGEVDKIHARPFRNPYWFLKGLIKVLNVGYEPGGVRPVPIWIETKTNDWNEIITITRCMTHARRWNLLYNPPHKPLKNLVARPFQRGRSRSQDSRDDNP